MAFEKVYWTVWSYTYRPIPLMASKPRNGVRNYAS